MVNLSLWMTVIWIFCEIIRKLNLLENLYAVHTHINSPLTPGHNFVRVSTPAKSQGAKSLFVTDTTGSWPHILIPQHQTRELKLRILIHRQKIQRRCSSQAAVEFFLAQVCLSQIKRITHPKLNSGNGFRCSAESANTLSPITTSGSDIKPRIPLLFLCYVHPW